MQKCFTVLSLQVLVFVLERHCTLAPSSAERHCTPATSGAERNCMPAPEVMYILWEIFSEDTVISQVLILQKTFK